MANKNNRNGRNGRSNRNWKNRGQGAGAPQSSAQDQQLAKDFFKTSDENIDNCPYCDKPVKYLNTAITVAGLDNPVHFDCIINKITEDEELSADEKVSYLGKGTFGIIRSTKDSPGFFVRKRIQIEPEIEKADWRKEMSNRIKKNETR